MANGNNTKLYQIIGIMAVGMISGGAGTVGYQKINPPRPDPFTGKMAAEMEERATRNLRDYIREQIGIVKAADARIEARLEQHLQFSQERVSDYDKRISRIEASYISEAEARRIFHSPPVRGMPKKVDKP